jgi:hypothetical protein
VFDGEYGGVNVRCPHTSQYVTVSLRDIEAEHLQLAVNARRSPHRVLRDHAEDEFAQFLVGAPSSRGVRCRESHVQYNLNPVRRQRTTVSGWTRTSERFHSGQSHHPEQPIRRSETGLRVPLLQGSELLPQGQIFQEQIATRTNGPGSQFEQEPQQT